MEQVPITLFCDNSGAVAQSKDPRNHKKGKHTERKYHIIQDIVTPGDVVVADVRTYVFHLLGTYVILLYNWLIL